MSGVFTPSNLWSGQLSNAAQTLIYTVAAGTTLYLKTWRMFQTNATTQTVRLYVDTGDGTIRQVGRFVLAQNEFADVAPGLDGPWAAGTKFYADTTTAAAVNHVGTGVLET